MNTRDFYIFCFVVFATALVMTSCRDQDFDFEKQYPGKEIKKEYETNWVKQFGAIDPNQDWSMAKNSSITVTVDSETNIKVYALNGDAYTLVGDYEGVSGTETLSFDVVKGTKDVYVSNGVEGVFANIGDAISFAGTRVGIVGTTTGGISVTKASDKDFEFTQNFVKSILEKLPPERHNVGNGKYSSDDFTYVAATDEVVVYPVFWEGWSATVSGIYYYDARNQIVRVPLYATKGNKGSSSGNLQEVLFYSLDGGSTWNGCTGTSPSNDSTYGNNSTINTSNHGDGTKYKSTGLVVNVGKGREFGFYIENLHEKTSSYPSVTKKYYSEKNNNISANNSDANKKAMIATLNVEGKTVLGIEDTYNSTSMDLNDVMFVVDDVVTISNTIDKWYIACEDLGDWQSGDYDFNDLVFEVQHVATSNNANSNVSYTTKVTPCAAGGTLKAEYSLNGGDSWTEIHASLGYPDATNGKYKMINTNSEDELDGKAAVSSGNYSMSGVTRVSDILNKLQVRVYHNGTTSTPIYINAPKEGSAPQMFVAPWGWNWPKERVDIRDAYPGFTDWSQTASADSWSTSIYKDSDGHDLLYHAPSK